MVKSYVELNASIVASVECSALLQFIINEYKPGTFSTSWSEYSMRMTTAEELIAECFKGFAELIGDPEMVDCDWLSQLPNMLIRIIASFTPAWEENGVDESSIETYQNQVAVFLGDAVLDISLSNMREA
jgi:hypothetical protein